MRFFSGRISSSGSGIPFTWRKIFMNSLPVMVSFSIRKSAILSKASRFSERSRFASAYAPFSIRITSTSISAAVASPQFNTVRPVRYWFSWVARPMSPNFSDIPYWVTMALAILVACSISLAAPVVTVSNTISSAARPARDTTSMASSTFFVFKNFSSSGTCITYPRAPMVLGTMVIFCTGSASFWRAVTRAWPTSW